MFLLSVISTCKNARGFHIFLLLLKSTNAHAHIIDQSASNIFKTKMAAHGLQKFTLLMKPWIISESAIYEIYNRNLHVADNPWINKVHFCKQCAAILVLKMLVADWSIICVCAFVTCVDLRGSKDM